MKGRAMVVITAVLLLAGCGDTGGDGNGGGGSGGDPQALAECLREVREEFRDHQDIQRFTRDTERCGQRYGTELP
jgi:hypothetical protein